MRAGDRRHRVLLQQRSTEQDEYGQPVEAWKNVQGLWCSIVPQGGKEVTVGDGVRNSAQYIISTRYVAGITAAMRLDYKGRFFNVININNIDERSREMQITCIEGLSDASGTVAGALPAPVIKGLQFDGGAALQFDDGTAVEAG